MAWYAIGWEFKSLYSYQYHNGHLAQSGSEQAALNRPIVGSNPIVPILMECSLEVWWFPYEEQIDGSIPSTPTLKWGRSLAEQALDF